MMSGLLFASRWVDEIARMEEDAVVHRTLEGVGLHLGSKSSGSKSALPCTGRILRSIRPTCLQASL